MWEIGLFTIGCLALLAAAGYWLYQGNAAITTTRITVTGERLPDAFQGFQIAHVSDFHNKRFGEGQIKILEQLKACVPDIIVITGDLIDGRRTSLDTAVEFVRGAVKIAPVYYVTGNHETYILEYPELERQLKAAGVTVLRDEKTVIRRSGESITLMGIDDPRFFALEEPDDVVDRAVAQKLDALMEGEQGYTVLLFHRPERFQLCCDAGIDLVFCGHAHGGQVRLPVVGGLYAPHQGVFPRYTAGLYQRGGTSMVVSRGVGDSAFPLRVNNPPEIVLVTLN